MHNTVILFILLAHIFVLMRSFNETNERCTKIVTTSNDIFFILDYLLYTLCAKNLLGRLEDNIWLYNILLV